MLLPLILSRLLLLSELVLLLLLLLLLLPLLLLLRRRRRLRITTVDAARRSHLYSARRAAKRCNATQAAASRRDPLAELQEAALLHDL